MRRGSRKCRHRLNLVAGAQESEGQSRRRHTANPDRAKQHSGPIQGLEEQRARGPDPNSRTPPFRSPYPSDCLGLTVHPARHALPHLWNAQRQCLACCVYLPRLLPLKWLPHSPVPPPVRALTRCPPTPSKIGHALLYLAWPDFPESSNGLMQPLNPATPARHGTRRRLFSEFLLLRDVCRPDSFDTVYPDD